MQLRITIETIDPKGKSYQQELLFKRDLDQLSDGSIGCSLDDGKAIMSEIQKIAIKKELELRFAASRTCKTCRSLLPIKDYHNRSVQTVFGPVQFESPRLIDCKKCNPGSQFTFSPITSICPDRATAELMELSARLGAMMSYRQASDVLTVFLPGQHPKQYTTLRNRSIRIEKRRHNSTISGVSKENRR